MFCPHCGAEIKDGAKFCTNCGNSIAPPAPPAEAAAPVVEAAAPVVEAAAPVVEAAAPVVEAAAPVVEAAAPAAPVYTAPAQEPVSAPQPQYQQPAPQYQQPAPQPQYQQPAPQPQYQQPQPQYQQPQPQYQQPAPQYQQPQPGQPPVPPQSAPKAEKKKGKTGLIIGIVAAVVVLAVAAILLFGGKLDTYNLEEYLAVEYYGTNGKADAYVDIDWEKLATDVGTKKGLDLKFLETFEDTKGEWKEIEDAFRLINVTTKNDENLSNGDKIDVSITYNNDVAKKAKLKFTGGDCQFTVAGLEDIPQVDPFEGLEVTFSGKSGDGYCDITYNGPNELIGSYDFEASEYFGLSNGDEITVTFSGYEGFEDFYGFEPTRMENTYVVEGLEEILRTMDDLDADWLAMLKAYAVERIHDSIDEYSANADYTVGEPEFIGSVLIVDEAAYFGNELYLVYRGIATFDEDDYLPTAIYFPARFSDLSTNGTEDDLDYVYDYIDGWEYLNYDSYDDTEGYVNPYVFCQEILDENDPANVSFEGEIGNYAGNDGSVYTLADISDTYMTYARERAKEVSMAELLEAYNLSASDVTNMRTVGEYLLIDPDEDYPDESILVVIAAAHVNNGYYDDDLYFPVEYDSVLCFGEYGYTDAYADPWYNNEDRFGYDSISALHASFTEYMTDYFEVEASPEIETYAANNY